MRPKVSIIVPTYNVENYLERCIKSLIGQTLKEIEIILVDDESPDSSPDICEEWKKKDSRIKVIHKKNGGLGFARNSGLEIATGEFVAFCDSDDVVDINMYKILYTMADNENLDAVYSEFNVDNYPGFHVIPHKEKTYNKNSIEDLILDMIGPEPSYNSDVKFQVSACKAIYRLDLIKQNMILFHSERELISEDLVFNIDFLQKAIKVKITPLQLYYYYLNPNSITHAKRPQLWNDLLRFYKYLYTRANEFKDKKVFKERLSRSILLGFRIAIGQEFTFFTNKESALKTLKYIYDNEFINEIKRYYPLSQMPLRHHIFYKILLSRNYFLICNLYKHFM